MRLQKRGLDLKCRRVCRDICKEEKIRAYSRKRNLWGKGGKTKSNLGDRGS